MSVTTTYGMLGSADRKKTLSTCDWNGQYIQCELCGERRLCTKRCSMVTCEDCQVDFLPPKGFL